jgi:hypothetical protein
MLAFLRTLDGQVRRKISAGTGVRRRARTFANWLDHTGRLGVTELVRLYWKHPESRGELADGRALNRLADRRFEVEP